jgi:hypothetical protein
MAAHAPADQPLRVPSLAVAGAPPAMDTSSRLYPTCVLPPRPASLPHFPDVTASFPNQWLTTEQYGGGWAAVRTLFPGLEYQVGSTCPLQLPPHSLPTPWSLGSCHFIASVPTQPSPALGGGDGGGGGGGASSSSSSSGSASGGGGIIKVAPSTSILFLDLCGLFKDFISFSWQFSGVAERVKDYFLRGYKVVLVSNSCHAEEAGTTARERFRMKAAAEALGVPCQIFISSRRDFYTLPNPGIHWLLSTHCNASMPIHAPSCLIVSGSVGRETDMTLDGLGFGYNLGIPVTTPEAFFNGSREPLNVRPILFLRGIGSFAPGEERDAFAVLASASIDLPVAAVLHFHQIDSVVPTLLSNTFSPPLHVTPPGNTFLFTTTTRAVEPPAAAGGGGGGGGVLGAVPRADFPWANVQRGAAPHLGLPQEVIIATGPPGFGKGILLHNALPGEPNNYFVVAQGEDSVATFTTNASDLYEGLGERAEGIPRSVIVDKNMLNPHTRQTALSAVFSLCGAPALFMPPGGVRVIGPHKSANFFLHCMHSFVARKTNPFNPDGYMFDPARLRTYCNDYVMPSITGVHEDQRIGAVTVWSPVWGAYGTRCPLAAFLVHVYEVEDDGTQQDPEDMMRAAVPSLPGAAPLHPAPAFCMRPKCGSCILDMALFYAITIRL